MDWSPRSRLRSLLADDAWRYGLLFGLASIPFTVVNYWQTGNQISPWPMFLAALLAGYLPGTRPDTSKPVGIRIGLVGSLPWLWSLVWTISFYLGTRSPLWFEVVAVGLGSGFAILFGGGAFVLIGIVGAKIGGWLAEKTGRRREDPPAAPA